MPFSLESFLYCVCLIVFLPPHACAWSFPICPRSFPKARKAASMLLYTLWNDKNVQGAAKKVNYAQML